MIQCQTDPHLIFIVVEKTRGIVVQSYLECGRTECYCRLERPSSFDPVKVRSKGQQGLWMSVSMTADLEGGHVFHNK